MAVRTDGSAKVLDAKALNRATLARQMLLQRAARPAVEVIEHLVGMQAQVPNDPYLGLWSRIEGFRAEELADLMLLRRVARCGLMRGTIHLVTAEDCLALRPLMQEVFDRVYRHGRSFGARLGEDIDDVVAACVALLKERPRTRAEVKAVLAERWPQHDPDALSFVLPIIPAVQTTPRGVWGQSGQARWALAEDWIGQIPVLETNIDEVVLRYLAAFGPASVADIRQWCGLTRLREVVERLRPELVTFRDESGRELFDVPEAPRPDRDTPAPPRFFPEYDNVFISHADRSRMAPEEFRGRMSSVWLAMDGRNFRSAGNSGDAPLSWSMFSVDGFLCGTWRIDRPDGSPRLLLQQMTRLSDDDAAAVVEEGRRLLGFVAGVDPTPLEVKFVYG